MGKKGVEAKEKQEIEHPILGKWMLHHPGGSVLSNLVLSNLGLLRLAGFVLEFRGFIRCLEGCGGDIQCQRSGREEVLLCVSLVIVLVVLVAMSAITVSNGER